MSSSTCAKKYLRDVPAPRSPPDLRPPPWPARDKIKPKVLPVRLKTICYLVPVHVQAASINSSQVAFLFERKFTVFQPSFVCPLLSCGSDEQLFLEHSA